jgi:hypothetical protein
MKHITNFESFVNESGFHAALAKAKDEGLEEFEFQGKTYPVKKGALKEGEELNEAALDKYYTIEYAEESEKSRADYTNKMIALAKKAIDELPTILEDCCPGVFDTKTLGFAFKGNAAFIFANVLNQKDRIGIDYGKIEDNKDFVKFCDLASSNLDANSSRIYSSYFRLDDRKK